MKKWIIPLAVLMVVPALGAAAPIVQPPKTELLVEGHTVFTVIEQVNVVNVVEEEFAAAVAVLVREANQVTVLERFPGVLWFNDQYLVNPVQNFANQLIIRHPCTGSVQAVNQGDPDPRPLWAAATPPVYIESYLITDPNDFTWNVDKWEYTDLAGTFPIWTVPILNNDAGYPVPDDGVSNCDPINAESGALRTPVPCTDDDPPGPIGQPDGSLSVDFNNPGKANCNDQNYITTPANEEQYNALLFFFLADLTVAGAPKVHHEGAPNPGDDISGCEAGTNPIFPEQWPCPAGNDDAEGNSHPYNPFYAVPSGGLCGNCVGRWNGPGGANTPNHGGSDGLPLYQHGTRLVDIYYHYNPAPPLRNYRVIDTEGSLAPYFCETDFDTCVPGDL